LTLEPFGPFVQMPTLHLNDPAGRRDRGSISQQQDGTRPFGQPGRNAWSPQHRLEFFTLLGRNRNNPLVLCHWNVLVQENSIFASWV
jgi:hypothetical protein